MSASEASSQSASTSVTASSTSSDIKKEDSTDSKMDPRFRPAKSMDFQEGKAIYVRGRRGICKRFEYPLVYWIYDGETTEKHRSFMVNPEMFTIAKSEEVVLMQKQKNQSELHPELKSSQSLQLEDCENCMVVVNEISNLVLINCTSVQVTFSAATTCDLKKSNSCRIVATACATYRLEECVGTKVSFPKSADSLQWTIVKSSKTVLDAIDGSKGSSPHEVEDGSFRTTYSKGSFSSVKLTETNGLT